MSALLEMLPLEALASWLLTGIKLVLAHPVATYAVCAILMTPRLLLAVARAQAPAIPMRAVTLRAATRRQRLVGWLSVLLFFGGGGSWAGLAPLASAALAPGVISPEGKRKTVQHLEGGIIHAIHVREGSMVRAGDPLLTLEDVHTRSQHDVLRGQYLALSATLARLEAEQKNAVSLVFPKEIAASSGDAGIQRVLATQRELFESHRAVRESRRQITRQRIAQLEVENRSLTRQIAAQATQLQLLETEIRNVKFLVDRELERLPRLLGLQRTKADIEGQLAALRGQIASNNERVGQAKLEDLTSEQQDKARINAELEETRRQLDEIRSRLPSSEDALARMVVRAPVDGEVINLKATTVGGVVRPGEPILDLMPSQTELVIEARLQPSDIKDVHRGLPVRVVLTAYPQRNLPTIHGVVREVSADRLIDERTGEPYFKVEVAVSNAEIAALDGEASLMSGMPAEVMIITGESTFLDHLLRPLYEAIRKAFRQSQSSQTGRLEGV